jgi:beta-lactam-binding protein with PASTA domain
VDDSGNQGNFPFVINTDGTDRQELSFSSDGTAWGTCVLPATGEAPPPLVDMTHITVPSVETLNVGVATKDLDAVNLTVGTVTYEYSSAAAENTVVSQDPSAGAVAHRTEKQGPPVNLVLSLGAPPPAETACVVPKMKGRSLKATKTAITAAHCEVGPIKRAFSRTFKKGRVLSERPGGGKAMPDASKIALTVSKGKRGRS